MAWCLAGVGAFLPLLVFDFCSEKGHTPLLSMMYPLSVALFFAGSLGLVCSPSAGFEPPTVLRVITGALGLFALFMLVYALFITLPKGTYAGTSAKTVKSDGLYGLCRHPGVLFFGLFYLCLWLTVGKTSILLSGIIWTCLDVFHVFLQDRFFFPRSLHGYEQYKKDVPFLIPSARSIRRTFNIN